MPRLFKFEGKTYSLPDGTTDGEALEFIGGEHPLPMPQDTRTKQQPQQSGLSRAAGQWWDDVKGLPVGIWQSLTTAPETMQHINAGWQQPTSAPSPVTHVRPLENAVDDFAQAGNYRVPDAIGHVAGMGTNAALLGLAGEGVGAALSPAGRAVIGGAAKGAWQGATEMVPVSHGMLPKLLGLPDVSVPSVLAGGGAGAGAGRFVAGHTGEIVGGAAGAAAPVISGAVKGGQQALKDFRFHQDLVSRPPVDYSGTSASTMRQNPADYSKGAHPIKPPVETGATPGTWSQMIPDYEYPIKPRQWPDKPALPPSGTMGKGTQAGFGPSPKIQPAPVEVGGTSVTGTNYMYPLPGVGEETQLFKEAPMHRSSTPSGSMGKGPQAGFGSKPVAPAPINSKSLPEGVNPPKLQPSPAEMAERIAIAKKAELAEKAKQIVMQPTKATAATSAKPQFPPALVSPMQAPAAAVEPRIANFLRTTRAAEESALGLTPAPGAATSTDPAAVGPGTIRNAAPHLDAKRHLFATGQELELPGSIAGARATDYIREHAQRVFGNSVSKLTLPQVQKMGEWLSTHKSLEGMPAAAPAEMQVMAGPTLEDQLQQSVDQARVERNGRLGTGEPQ